MIMKKVNTAYSIWQSLQDLFRDNKEARAMQLENEIRSLELGDMSVTDYCQKLKVLSDLLANIDQPVPERNLVSYLINGLGGKFKSVSSIIRHSHQPYTFLQARSMLLLEESISARAKPVQGHHRDTPSAPSALYAGGKSIQNERARENHRGNFDNRRDRGNDNRRGNDRNGRRNTYSRRGNDRRQPEQSPPLGQQNSLPPWTAWSKAAPPPWSPPQQWLQQMAASAAWASPPWGSAPPAPPAGWTQQRNSPVPPPQNSPAAFYSNWAAHGSSNDQDTALPQASQTLNLQDPANEDWIMDTGATNHLASDMGSQDQTSSHPM